MEAAKAKAVERCTRAGIHDLQDCGAFCFDGAPEELMDKDPDSCENHLWFSHVWPWGRKTIEDEGYPEGFEGLDDRPDDERVFPQTKAGEIRGMSDFRFYEMVQQLSHSSATRALAVRMDKQDQG